ncbi:MAG: hypothetical protein LBE18_03170 [Planctomycetaceae bacterium]|nr:hypothetical protein [Planctomycetaceae bacterium]
MKNFISIILAMLITTFAITDIVTAQPIRRLIRRILESDSSEPYRVGQQSDNQQNESNRSSGESKSSSKSKRLLERTIRTINLIANNGTELKSVIAVSIASFDDYKRVIHTVAEQIRKEHGNTEQPVELDNLLNLYEKFISKHFDSKQPFGLIIQTDGILYYPLIFMPLNADSNVIKQLGNNYAEKLDNGRYAIKTDKFKWPLGNLYVQQHNGWIFIATEFQLDSLPNDPLKLLPKSDETNKLLTAIFDLKNIPQLATRAALTLAEIDAAAKAETVIEKATARLSIGHIRSLAEQAEFIEYAFYYDEKKNDYVIHEIEIASPNTEQAKLMQQRRNITSPFHAFYMPENAVLASHLAVNMTKLQRSQYEIILDEAIGQYLLTAEERKELKSISTKQKSKKLNPNNSNNPDNPDNSNESGKSDQTVENHSAENNYNSNNNNNDANDDINEFLPKFPFDKDRTKDGEFTGKNLVNTQKLEIILRRIAVCYYWGLLGSIRCGQLDTAATWSDDNGVIGAFKITEGEQFTKAFDLMFAEMAKEFPDVYSANVRKDYRQFHGFNLTSVTVKLSDLLKESPIKFFVTENLNRNNGNDGLNILLAVRQDAVCYSIDRAANREKQEKQFETAIEGIEKSLPVYDIFFVFSAYELGKIYAKSGNPNRFKKLKSIASTTSPNAVIQAKTEFTENSKTITIRASALLTPSLWRLKEK